MATIEPPQASYSITVVNIKTCAPEQRRYGIYIGRANARYGLLQSPLANPFRIEGTQTQDDVVRRYREWLERQLKFNNPQRRYLDYLTDRARESDLTLLCWCDAGQLCHGYVIKDVIQARLQERF